mmetsp:Transcript_75323/g.232977  ORF Transcript_75323/g.232977 Transcript_75323/m.232977 type:complete len:344 (-) Transcript_75323:175-1206(-)|eukprot:CAMPEP_0204597246 /NCGR_PEP_ID=MMETSP0661-20131031/53700_1 /ASSEMBLY_ACC=CAM_ASM_000606 /TAXON_ID=109239 /ORGANISM="Alexandrium margalefi, Strain AMGDE01CS-322" /LENGTH=343 /DNA_ID=CAMNT_0051607929 /DNA_START=49 /DNA_END=1080 /DNA_ORIENTATION=-
MTTQTGSTDMREVPGGPPFLLAVAGTGMQLGVLGYCWYCYSPAKDCLRHPLYCLSHPLESDAWGFTVVFGVVFALLMWLASLRTLASAGTSDPSIVDRLWSIMPWLYAWYWAVSSRLSPRPLLQAVLSTVWGLRLTYNFWLKGGYGGGEDYRWAVVRRWYMGWRFEMFNLVFICLYQQLLLVAFSAPAAAAAGALAAPMAALDGLAAVLFSIFLVGEAVADRQMFTYQTEKYRRRAAGEDPGSYARGFVETGLWSLSRHPNYFCEVMMWWCFYLFSISATGQWLNWTILGPVFLSALFLVPGGSLDLAEAISRSKYPAYVEYQRNVSKFLPLPLAVAAAAKRE